MLTYVIIIMKTYVNLLFYYINTQPPIHVHVCMHARMKFFYEEFHKNIPSCNYLTNKNYSQVQSVHCVMNQ